MKKNIYSRIDFTAVHLKTPCLSLSLVSAPLPDSLQQWLFLMPTKREHIDCTKQSKGRQQGSERETKQKEKRTRRKERGKMFPRTLKRSLKMRCLHSFSLFPIVFLFLPSSCPLSRWSQASLFKRRPFQVWLKVDPSFRRAIQTLNSRSANSLPGKMEGLVNTFA